MLTTNPKAKTRSILGAFLFIAALAGLGAGCARTSTNGPQNPLTDQQASDVVRQQRSVEPVFAIYLKDRETAYIVASIRESEGGSGSNLLVLKQEANAWQEQPLEESYLACSTPQCPSDVEKTEIEGKPYVYFVTESYGTELGSVEFNAFSPVEKHTYTMSFSGPIDAVNEPDPVPQDVKDHPAVQAYLASKIAASPKVAPAKDEHADASGNPAERWLRDNPHLYGLKAGSKSLPIAFAYGIDDPSEFWKTPIESSVENTRYAFTSYVGGPVIGLDKAEKKYFVAYVPEESARINIMKLPEDSSILHIELLTGTTLAVDLNNSRVSIP